MKKTRILAVLNAVFFLVHLVPSQLTQLRIFNQQTIGEVSGKYPTLFTPAGITFAIWGVIYIALAAFCGYHLAKAFREDEDEEANRDLNRVGYLFILNNLATGAWTIAWVYEYLFLSVVLILVQLFTLLAIQVRLGIYNPGRSVASRWFTQFPLSIYFGWIIIATVANISAALVGWEWSGWGMPAEFWAILLIAVATLITVFVVLNRRNPFVGLVTMWAFYGIILKHQELNLAASPRIILSAWVGVGITALVILFRFYRNAQIKTSI